MHRRASLQDFEAHEQRHAKPKFATAGRRESGYQADQKRRTSQPAGEATEPPCRRCAKYTGKSSPNASPGLGHFLGMFTPCNTLAGDGGGDAGHHQGGSRVLNGRRPLAGQE
jgi:hypothetical protein